MNGFRNASYVGFVLFLIGLVVTGYGLYNLTIEKKLDSVGIKTKGKVYDLAVIEPYRKAMVEFKNDKGKRSKCSTTPPTRFALQSSMTSFSAQLRRGFP